MLQEPELNEEQVDLWDRFCEASGYGSDEVLSVSYHTRTFLTKNGGKYRMLDDGIEWIEGPPAEAEDRMEF